MHAKKMKCAVSNEYLEAFIFLLEKSEKESINDLLPKTYSAQVLSKLLLQYKTSLQF